MTNPIRFSLVAVMAGALSRFVAVANELQTSSR